jgi:hypothetical protein
MEGRKVLSGMQLNENGEEKKRKERRIKEKKVPYKEDLLVLCCVLYILTRTCTLHCRLLN